MVIRIYCITLPRLAAAEGLFLFGIKKKQNRGLPSSLMQIKKDKQLINKMPAENFSLGVRGLAGPLEPEKFIRPGSS